MTEGATVSPVLSVLIALPDPHPRVEQQGRPNYTLEKGHLFTHTLSTTPRGGQGKNCEQGHDLGQFRLVLLGPTVELRQKPQSSLHSDTEAPRRAVCLCCIRRVTSDLCLLRRRNGTGRGFHPGFPLKSHQHLGVREETHPARHHRALFQHPGSQVWGL